MTARDYQELFEKLKTLPDQQQTEVADFVDFLSTRAQRDEAVAHLFDTMGKLAAMTPAFTEAEIDAEIAAVRANRR